ncbi:MAG: hypothetical protein HQ523_02940 [Lentisphaerae bacterium]|nr:hypothetical protein [Lentisphaerota bacterium]
MSMSRHGKQFFASWVALLMVVANGADAGAAPQGSYILTGPHSGESAAIALDYIRTTQARASSSPSAVATRAGAWSPVSLVKKSEYISTHNRVTHLNFGQDVGGIEVFRGDVNIHVSADGSIISMQDRTVRGGAAVINTEAPSVSAQAAIAAAASHLGLTAPPTLILKSGPTGVAQNAVFDWPAISMDPIPVKLVYVKRVDNSLRLAWLLVVRLHDGQHWWTMNVDALNGEVLSQYNLISDADYKVYPLPLLNPDDGPRTTVTNPADATASPFGWHDTNGVAGAEFTDTRGNNVYAQEDADGNNTGGIRPDGGASLIFDFLIDTNQAPSTYRSAATANLFYWNNLCHDIHYLYGFDEASGNFQANNYGNGGFDGDPVQADAQDGSGINNANFGTPPDGSPPRMQMFLFNLTSPYRDGDLENSIIVHEYGHGVSTRLVGGPLDVYGLRGAQSGGMGEGWSDWWGLAFTAKPGETGADARGIGTYVLGQAITGPGIRNYPYSTNMMINPWTYGMLPLTGGEVHNVGEIWCAVLWDMYWNLVDVYGFDPDLHAGVGGNNIAMQLVIEGLKLTPSDPTFLVARDAIVQADLLTYGGTHLSEIWLAFARRGMGPLAEDGGGHNSLDVTESFDLSGGVVLPDSPYVAIGEPGVGPFLPSNQVYRIMNLSTSPANWQVTNSAPWLTVMPQTVLLQPFASTDVVATVVQSVATGMVEGIYADTIYFENLTDAPSSTSRDALLRVGSNYVMRSTPFDWIDPVAGRHSQLPVGGGVAPHGMMFSFTFYGVRYGALQISSRGVIGLLNEILLPGENADIPSADSPNAIIAPLWDDLVLRADSAVYSGLEGEAPNRRRVFTWLNVGHSLDTSARYSFQAIICEQGDAVQPENDLIFQYKNVSKRDGVLGAGRSATIGIEDAVGQLARRYSFNGSTLLSDRQALLFTMNAPPPDTAPPSAVIAVESHSSTTVQFSVTFDELVTGLATNDFVLGGTWPGAALLSVDGSGQTYTVDISIGSGLGAVELSLNAAAVLDLAGNPNAATGPAVYVAPLPQTVFFDNMEAGPDRWTPSEGVFARFTMEGWEWGVPSYGPVSTPSGTHCWGTVLDSTYPSDMNAWVQSVSIPVGDHPVLEFRLWLAIELGYDFGYVDVHDGSGWINVTPGGVYTSGTSGAWLQERIELDNDAFGNRNIRVRFRMESDFIFEYAGMYVDDVRVLSDGAPGVWVTSYQPSNAVPSSAAPVTVEVYNATTTTLHNVAAAVASVSAGLTVTGGPTVSYGTMVPGVLVSRSVLTANFGAMATFEGSPVYLSHGVSADEGFLNEEWLPIDISGVLAPAGLSRLTARSVPGVVDWRGVPLQGSGGATAARFQVIYAGSNGVVEPPAVGGAVSGDDAFLFALSDLLPYGRFGEGATVPPNLGLFDKGFRHGLSAGDKVYVRAWDGPGYATSIAYGDSTLKTLAGLVEETKDFGRWIVGSPIDFIRDLNGDSVPDGWDVLMGNDARLPLGPLPATVMMESTYGGLYEPGRVVATTNFVFVADTRNHRILVLSTDLSTILQSYGTYGVGAGQFRNPQGVDFYAAANRLVVADTRNYRIVLLDVNPLTGALSFNAAFGSQGQSAGEFNAPFAVAVVPTSGQILVADSDFFGVASANHRVQRFSSTGTWQMTIGSKGSGSTQFLNPLGISVGASNRVYVADAGNHRIKSMDIGGSSVWLFGTRGSGYGELDGPRDVREGQAGWLFIADTENSRLVVLDARSAPATVRYVQSFGMIGSGDGQFRYPQGIFAIDAGGPIYVADTLNQRVQRITIRVDGDGDGMDDLWEDRMGLDPTDPNDWDDDPDHDGVINIGEYRVGTDPLNGDSNGNGGGDGLELGLGRDPLADPGLDLLIIRDLIWTPYGVDFNVLSGGVYQVETRTNLLYGAWDNLGAPVTGAAHEVLSVPLPTPVDPARFYRIQKTN